MLKQISKARFLHPYFLIFAAMLFYLYDMILQVSPSILMLDLTHEFHVNAFAYGNMVAICYFTYSIMQLPVGVFYDCFGIRWVIIIAASSCVLGTLLFAESNYFYLLYISRFIIGIGSAFALIGIMQIANKYFTKDKLSLLIGLAMSVGTFGAMLSNIALTYLVEKVNWRHAMLIIFALGVIILSILVMCLIIIDDVDQRGNVQHNLFSLRESLWQLLKIPGQWINAIVSLFIYVPISVFAFLWSIPYLKFGLGFSAMDAAIINATLFLGYGIGSPMVGAISDKLKKRKIFLIVAAMVGTMALSLVVLLQNQSKVLACILYFIVGVCVACETLAFTIAKELVPEKNAAASFGFTNLISCVGAAFLQSVIGLVLISHKTGDTSLTGASAYNYQSFFHVILIFPACYILALIFLFWLPETGEYKIESA